MKKRKFSPILGGRYVTLPSYDRYQPDDYDDMGTELPEEEFELEVPIDDVFVIDSSSSIEDAEESKFDWAMQEDSSDENWYIGVDGYEVAIRDSGEIIDDVLSVLEANMPYKPGKYHVTGTVVLVYRVSGIVTWEYATGPSYYSSRYDEDFSEYDSGIDTEDMDVKFIFGKSYISNLNTESIK